MAERVPATFIRKDVALAHVINKLSGLIGPEGQRPPAQLELSLRILVKEGGAWRVAAFHNTIVQPLGTAGQQRQAHHPRRSNESNHATEPVR